MQIAIEKYNIISIPFHMELNLFYSLLDLQPLHLSSPVTVVGLILMYAGVGPVAARVQSFMEDVGGMSLRVEQLLVDQEVMHRKMDLLTAVFQPALITD